MHIVFDFNRERRGRTSNNSLSSTTNYEDIASTCIIEEGNEDQVADQPPLVVNTGETSSTIIVNEND